jgi:hypothetical protein
MRLISRVVFSLLAMLAACLLVVAFPARARADDRDTENELDDRQADGDIDAEDRVAFRIGGSGSSDLHGQSWVSVLAFERALLSGKSDVGGGIVLGLALDRVAAGTARGLRDPPGGATLADSSASEDERPAADPLGPPSSPSLARQCVAAAWRASGLGQDDSRIDALVSRARASALFPEARVRAMRLWDDAAHATTLATTNDTTYYDAIGANLVLEVRLTWRLDRLLYAGDEPTLERVRLERQEARTRVATRTLEALFSWRRARIESAGALAGSPEQAEARLREGEAEATLDVLTDGWFSARDAP